MSDERGPVWRPSAHQDRDRYTDKHATPRGGVPSFVEEEITGHYTGKDLQERRSRRQTPERFQHIERRQDEHSARQDEFAKVLSDTREDIAKMSGSLETLVKIAEAKEQRWKHLPAIIKALGIAIVGIMTAYGAWRGLR